MKIVKVNNLPQTYEADTIYIVKSSTAGLMDFYVTDSTGLEIRALPIGIVSKAQQNALNLKADLTNPELTTPVITGTREKLSVMSDDNIDLATGNYFTKTISGDTTFTVTDVPSAGVVVSFILELTNAGSAVITWFSGVKWAGGTPPTLTESGVDVLRFYTHDGGTTWRGFLLSKDSR